VTDGGLQEREESLSEGWNSSLRNEDALPSALLAPKRKKEGGKSRALRKKRRKKDRWT